MPPAKEQPASCDVLILGLERTGKTFLVRQLQRYSANNCSSEGLDKQHHDCIPSHGANLDTLKFPSAKNKKVIVKEVGGSMLITWKRFLDDCKCIMYCIDGSNELQLAAACLELLNLLARLRQPTSEETSDATAFITKPVLVVFNKRDAPVLIPMQVLMDLLHWAQLSEHTKLDSKVLKASIPAISCAECSGYTGFGFDAVVSWMQACCFDGRPA